MTEFEILNKANLILLEAESSRIEFVDSDGMQLSEESFPEDFPAGISCDASNKHLGFLHALNQRLVALEERTTLWTFLAQSFKHDSPHHNVLEVVLVFLLQIGRTGEAIRLYFDNFHLCEFYRYTLSFWLKLLRFQDSLFADEDLVSFGRRLSELTDNDDVQYWADKKSRKSYEEEEYNFTAIFVYASQYLFHPLIRNMLVKRLEGELQSPNPEVDVHLHALPKALKDTGFSHSLIQSFIRAEKEFKTASDTLDFKSSLDLFRSFLEHLCREALTLVGRLKGIDSPFERAQPSEVRSLLSKPEIALLDQKEVALLSSIYSFISNRAVHCLSTVRDEAVTCRNLTIEMANLIIVRTHSVLQNKK